MRSTRDHVFIDCGPLGLAGRGGHGHNDCLAFEAVLDGVPLVSDCGAYLYTASFEERNRFRSTAYHNTPQVDGEEINRYIRPDYLWNLHYDAVPRVLKWQVENDHALFVGEHQGYSRLDSPVIPRRTILLDFDAHALYIKDEFLGEGMHDRRFRLWWLPDSGYAVKVDDARVSPSYGVVHKSKKLVWFRATAPLATFGLFVAPVDAEMNIESRVSQWLSIMS
jgi:uncharacterized heparinase superfamily protein